MAASSLAENKRFVYYSPDKKRTEYLVPINRPQSRAPTRILRIPTIEITDASTFSPRPIATPARRVVVVRPTKHAQNNQIPVDLKDFEQADSEKGPRVIQRGNSSVYFLRRSIAASDPPKSVE